MLKSNAQLELGVAGLWAHGSVPLLSNSLVQLSRFNGHRMSSRRRTSSSSRLNYHLKAAAMNNLL